MPHLLELAQLAEPDNVPQMNIRAAGIKPLLQSQRPAGFQELHHLLLTDDFRYPPLQQGGRHPGSHLSTFSNIDIAFSTSRFIWALRSSGVGKRFSARNRSMISILISFP